MVTLPEFDGPCTLERAISIAALANEGKKDKAGAPFILHPLRVMEAQKTEEACFVAVLHDVVEYAGIALEELSAKAKLSPPADSCYPFPIMNYK